jgi:hypothetical protein
MSLPDLPLELIVTVAEFLAGDHAFATLATLHSTNHQLKEETSSILYETLFLDNKNRMPTYLQDETEEGKRKAGYTKSVTWRSEGYSSHASHTRFCFCHDFFATADAVHRNNERFPNLMATIDGEGPDRFSDHAGVHRFSIRLHKPIKSSTLFGVITQTPAYTASRAANSGRQILAGLQELHSLYGRYSDELDDAYLVRDEDHSPKWTTRIRLCDTRFEPTFHGECGDRAFDTLFELLKLAGRLQTRDRDCKLVAF